VERDKGRRHAQDFAAAGGRLTDPSSRAWSRTRECTALGTQQRAAPSPVQRRVGRQMIAMVLLPSGIRLIQLTWMYALVIRLERISKPT
jgi:hypothetical protein